MRAKSVILGSTVALTFFVLIPLGLIALSTVFSFPTYSSLVGKIIGLILFLSGFLLFAYCFKLFILLGKGTPVPVEPPNQLVSSRLYSLTRNPIYISYFMLFFGLAFFFGHALLFLYALLSLPTVHFYVTRIEEPELAKRFGKSYTEYCKTTPRWIWL